MLWLLRLQHLYVLFWRRFWGQFPVQNILQYMRRDRTIIPRHFRLHMRLRLRLRLPYLNDSPWNVTWVLLQLNHRRQGIYQLSWRILQHPRGKDHNLRLVQLRAKHIRDNPDSSGSAGGSGPGGRGHILVLHKEEERWRQLCGHERPEILILPSL